MRSSALQLFRSAAATLALLGALACNTPQTTVRRSSLMDYLYPKEKSAPAVASRTWTGWPGCTAWT